MFDVPVLDFVLGLFFIFLLYALLISGINTFWGVVRGSRNSFLEEKIKRLLHPQSDAENTVRDETEELFQKFEADPIIDQMRENKFLRNPSKKSKGELFPSALSEKQFYKVLLKVIIDHDSETGNGNSESPLETGNADLQAHLVDAGLQELRTKYRVGEVLWGFWQKSEGNLDKFEKEIESWYNDYMDHASQDYRRKQRTPLFVFGVLFSLILNIDAVHITERMWSDSTLQESVLSQATAFIEENAENDSAQLNDITYKQFQKYSESMNLPIGWGQVFQLKDEYAAKIDSSKILLLDKLQFTVAEINSMKLEGKQDVFVPTTDTIWTAHVSETKNDSVIKGAGFTDEIKEVFALSSNWKAEMDTSIKKYVCTKVGSPGKDFLFPCVVCGKQKAADTGCTRPKWALTRSMYDEQPTSAQISAVFSWIGHFPGSFVWKLLGFLISAFIASLGSPFWFDMMRKIISIRKGGKTEN